MHVSKIWKSTSGLWGFAVPGPTRATGHRASFKCSTSVWINRRLWSSWLQQWFTTEMIVWRSCSRFFLPSLHDFSLPCVAPVSFKQSNLLLPFNKTHTLQGLLNLSKKKNKKSPPRLLIIHLFSMLIHSFMCFPQFLSKLIPLPLCLQSHKKAHF